MKRRAITFGLVFMWSFLIVMAGKVQKEIVNLRTNYEVNPLGIEENPNFSWEMLASEGYGAQQKAYQIFVSESQEDLNNNKYVYDSGKQISGISVNIPYKGLALKPSTRYYWKVTVWDEKNKPVNSVSTSWFETSLLNSGWSNAQWIGSQKSSISKYTGKANINYDFTIAKGSSKAAFLFGYRGEDNFMRVIVDVTDKNHSMLILNYKHNGELKEALAQDISEIISPNKINEKHSVCIKMLSFKYFNGYSLNILVDGKDINTLKTSKQKADKPINVELEKQNIGFKYARLYGIGFYQEKGQNAKFENISMEEPFYNVNIYKNKKVYDIKGEGVIKAWIPNGKYSAPMLRKTFNVIKPIKSARLYATARGIYEMSLNGNDVAQDFFNPGWPDFRFRQTYNTFDVTSLLQQGKNAIGAVLGKGYYTGAWGYNSKWGNAYGADINLMAKLLITYTDGTQDIIVTDPTWTYTDKGPILENGMLEGEDYDARKEIPNWNKANFDDSKWSQVKVFPNLDASVKLQSYIGQPVRADEVCTAKKMTEPVSKHFIYDMGQNMAGIPRLFIKGKKGQKIEVRYAEMTYPDVIPTNPVAPYTIEMYKEKKGQMYIDNYRGALSTDHYICKGDEKGEIFEPHFTSHGFRYLEITGLDAPLALEDVKVLVLNSLQEETASYETDIEKTNKLYNNIIWGQKSNFQLVPTDCPQRDERLGWTGDAQIFTRTATYNRNVQPFYNRWLYTMRDDQSSEGGFPKFAPLATTMVNYDYNNACNGWADVGIITPWEVYQQYGDKNILEKSYASMKNYMNFLQKKSKNYLQPIGGYGDWVALLGTPSDLTNTAYYAWDVKIMSKIANVLGKKDDEQQYNQLFENIKKAFTERYIRQDGYLIMPAGSPALRDSYSAAFGTGPKTTKDTILDTQTGYILPLYVGLIDDNIKAKSVSHLVELLKKNNYKLNTGFIGTPYMNIVLSDNGYDDVAYKMFQQDAYPSWLYPVDQGATTIWERWNSYTLVNGFGPVDMNSFNHYSYGAIQDWMMAYNAGIQRDESQPGYKHIQLQPRVGGTFGYVCAQFHSVYGEINSSWKSNKTDENADAALYGYTYQAQVPANTTATLVLKAKKKVSVKEGKKGIISSRKDGDKVIYELQSGQYSFEVE